MSADTAKEMRVKRWIWLLVALIVTATAWGTTQPARPAETPADTPSYDASVPRERQIQLALSAAPEEVSRDAAVYVLGARGLEKEREGSNGFTCLVERDFHGKTLVSIAPKCYDAVGTEAFLPVDMRQETLRADGKSEDQVNADIAAGYKSGRFKVPGKPGFLYMMSPENYLYDPLTKKSSNFPGHLMFYAPYATAKDIGYSNLRPGMTPIIADPGEPDAMIVVVPAR